MICYELFDLYSLSLFLPFVHCLFTIHLYLLKSYHYLNVHKTSEPYFSSILSSQEGLIPVIVKLLILQIHSNFTYFKKVII